MKNWSGYLSWSPSSIYGPTSEDEIKNLVLKALNDKKKVRVMGSGHSFTPLSKTEEVLIHLDNYQGLVSIDKERCQATIKGGTKLNTLGNLLFEQGMAMENLGDIDTQSLAGTISTGTHGTGSSFGTMSTQVVKLRIVNGLGKVVTCSDEDNQELFKAAQVSLGLLGVITEITLQCVPAYRLKLKNRKEPIDKVLSELQERNRDNRNFEFYFFPYSESVWTKTSNIATDEVDKIGLLNYFSDYVIENYAFKLACEVAYRFPSKTEWISKTAANSVADVDKVLHSHKVYATQRLVKFNEMEYNVPIESYKDVWKDIKKIVNSKRFNIHFPIENRFVKGDDILLSPAYGRDSAYLACHAYYKKDPKPYFRALEEVFQAYDGRPHWGKMNTLTTTRILERYPKFELFMKHRAEQDPNQLYVSPYLRHLLSI